MLTSVNPSSVLLLLYILKYPHVKFQNKAVLCDGSCMSEQTSHFTNIFKMPLFWTIHGRFFLCLNVCKLSHHTIFSLGLHFFRMPWYIVATLYVCVCANTHLDVQTWCQTVVCVCVCVWVGGILSDVEKDAYCQSRYILSPQSESYWLHLILWNTY